jgi:hypothetical protein
MKRRVQMKEFYPSNHKELSQQTAFHEAGHAAAIYLGNKQKQLPPVFFQIFIKELKNSFESTECLCKTNDNCIAIIDGGRLIHTLPSSIEEAINDFPPEQKQAYQLAFEADIFNILAGPLAEAKYVALRDDEPINSHLVSLDALQNYGGASDIESVNDYLDCFITCGDYRRNKINELVMAAFSFVNNIHNWSAITALANYLVARSKNIINCEEVMAVIDHTFYNSFINRRDNAWPSNFIRNSLHQTEQSPL